MNLIKDFIHDLEMNKLNAYQQCVLFVGGNVEINGINSNDCTGTKNKECTNTLKCDHSSNGECSNTGTCLMANNGCDLNTTNCVQNTQGCGDKKEHYSMLGFPGFDLGEY